MGLCPTSPTGLSLSLPWLLLPLSASFPHLLTAPHSGWVPWTWWLSLWVSELLTVEEACCPHPQPATGIYIKGVCTYYSYLRRGRRADTGAFVRLLPARLLPARHSSRLVPAAIPPPPSKVPVGPASFLCLRCDCHTTGGGQGPEELSVGRAHQGTGLHCLAAVWMSVCCP